MENFEGLIQEPLVSTQDFADEMCGSQIDPLCLVENPFELECMFDILTELETSEDISYGLTEDSICILSMPENAISRKIYARYQTFLKVA